MVSGADHADELQLLGSVYEQITETVAGLEPRDFLRPTRAAAWTVQDLLFHVLLDAQRALTTFASPTSAAADVDEVSYWTPYRPDQGDGGAAHARFVRVASSAYSSPGVLVDQWRTTSAAALRAAGAAAVDGRFETQGHVLDRADFISTLLVEATIHSLDLTVDLPVGPPPAKALRVVRRVLDGLLGQPVAARWSDTEYALKATGRVPLTDDDRRALGKQVDRLPLLG